ncbi:PGF-CTERM sorting domain-containing protein [Natronomonas aquatica]
MIALVALLAAALFARRRL